MKTEWISALFALLAASTWGAGDFSGGIASKRTNALSVVILAHISSLLLLIVLIIILHEPVPTTNVWVWGGIAGLCGAIGLVLLYSSLANGKMSIAAPISAVVAAGVPVVAAAFTSGLPANIVLCGFGFVLAAIWLISSGNNMTMDLALLQKPIIAGFAFGFFFLCLHQASIQSVLYPLVAVRIVSISSTLIYAQITHQAVFPTRDSINPILISGILDTIGNGAYAISAQTGRVDISAVLGSLYPASTVILAWIVLKEHISRKQILGVAASLTAIILITI